MVSTFLIHLFCQIVTHFVIAPIFMPSYIDFNDLYKIGAALVIAGIMASTRKY